MQCPVCPEKLSLSQLDFIDQACGSCQRHLKQMLAGFRGLVNEVRPKKTTWDNSQAYDAWKCELTEDDIAKVALAKEGEYVEQRCSIRDMKRVVGMPRFLSLEKQVFTAWILEGQKDERIQEVMGLGYSQLTHIKKVIKVRLQKQMRYYNEVKKLEEEGKSE